jgi:hypothetical protein
VRLTFVAPVLLVAVASCGSKTPPGQDLDINVYLAMDGSKCVVRFRDVAFKKADRAVAWTGHSVIWHVVGNDCGERTKVDKKALGLKYMRLKSSGEPAPWFKDCKPLDHIPAGGGGEFTCPIPSSKSEGWRWNGDVLIYEYEIDGDQVEPADPDVGVKRNG